MDNSKDPRNVGRRITSLWYPSDAKIPKGRQDMRPDTTLI